VGQVKTEINWPTGQADFHFFLPWVSVIPVLLGSKQTGSTSNTVFFTEIEFTRQSPATIDREDWRIPERIERFRYVSQTVYFTIKSEKTTTHSTEIS